MPINTDLLNRTNDLDSRREFNSMRQALVPSENVGTSYPAIRGGRVARLASILVYAFVALTALAVFIPLNPRMPARGTDPSWESALNVAVAQHLSFGKQILFFYGPYASIGTRNYHPATDLRMMCGSLALGASYITALIFLAHGRKLYLIVLLLLFLATFGSPELLLLSYSFLLVTCVIKETRSDHPGKPTTLSWHKGLAVVLLWSTLGLLPLVKGTLLLPALASAAVSSALLYFNGRVKQAIFLLSIPVAATIALWAIAGQSIANLPAFVRGTVLLTSGYTEAMSGTWSVIPTAAGNGLVVASIAIASAVCWSIVRSDQLAVGAKWMLALLFAVFVLEAFKHAFVVLNNMPGVFAALSVYCLIVGFLYTDRFLVWALSIAMLLAAATSVRQDSVLIKAVHDKFGVGVTWRGERRGDVLAFCLKQAGEAYSRTTYKSTWKTYSGAWEGLRSRVTDGNRLQDQFAKSIGNIRSEYPIPPFQGSADLYANDQSVLLASNNTWDPRPMFQSFTSYTPAVVRLNEEHLRGPEAPDWVLFDLDTIDERLPSLDDGISWPALWDNYAFVSYDGQFVLLKKRPMIRASSSYDDVARIVCKTGTVIPLPDADGPLFAEVDLKPTLMGRLSAALYKPPQLHIVLGFGDGKTRGYRVVSNMMTTGFLVSPLVTKTAEFAALSAGGDRQVDDARVESISIAPAYGGSMFWSDTYVLTLKRYIRE